jgi:predicted branched-subunit amino acid permease
MTRDKRDFWRGLASTLPLLPGVAAFGLLYGVMARQVGLSPGEVWAMSLIVHAGSAQFTVLGMWETAGVLPIVLTTLVINLRHLLLGASIAPYLRGLSPLWQAFLALWMSDESYAVAIAEYERELGSHHYFLGANLGIYVAWTTSGLIGAWLGAALPNPEQYGLNLVFPLGFMGLLTAFLRDWNGLVVAMVAGGLAQAGTSLLPGQSRWMIVVAGLLGSSVGLLLGGARAAWKRS